MKKIAVASLVLLLAVTPFASSFAAPTGTLSQTIDAGTLSTDIRNASYVPVPAAAFGMASTPISTSCQTSTGTYGDNAQRIYVDNPGGADNGWNLTIAATDGAVAKWVSGGDEYDFDDPAGSGCTNGQLSLDPSVATLTLDGSSTSTGITQGSADAFDNDSDITLLSAASGSDDIWRGYLTGIGVSQTIPSMTPSGTYTIDLTQTVTAL